jgi:ADP-ribose pyrophosphatase YjhB (NUDIX family)
MSSLKNKYSNYVKPDEPIVSYGIICFHIDSMDRYITNKDIETYFYNKFIDIEEYNYMNLDNISQIPEYYDKIKILLIRRKHSLNYIEFIRGKYEISELLNKKLDHNIFELMSYDELIKIKTVPFDTLWDDLWKETAKHKAYQKEYKYSKKKFTELQSNDFFGLIDSTTVKYMDPEWGFPKGRRNSNETNLVCALREFSEETHIDINQLHILERLNCLEEDFVGTNMKNYRHVYYMAHSDNMIEVSNENVQLNEVGDIGWFTIPEALEKIRPYYEEKKKIIHMIYFFIINMIINISTENENEKKLLF